MAAVGHSNHEPALSRRTGIHASFVSLYFDRCDDYRNSDVRLAGNGKIPEKPGRGCEALHTPINSPKEPEADSLLYRNILRRLNRGRATVSQDNLLIRNVLAPDRRSRPKNKILILAPLWSATTDFFRSPERPRAGCIDRAFCIGNGRASSRQKSGPAPPKPSLISRNPPSRLARTTQFGRRRAGAHRHPSWIGTSRKNPSDNRQNWSPVRANAWSRRWRAPMRARPANGS